MPAKIIDGKTTAALLRERVAVGTRLFLNKMGRRPSLHVILVGDNPASRIYVCNKERAAKKCGIDCVVHRFNETAPEGAVRLVIDQLNERRDVDAIMVQLPLPIHMIERNLTHRIAPYKDADALHPLNVGTLTERGRGIFMRYPLYPCTAAAIRHLIPEGTGNNAVVIGRSNIVGKPASRILLEWNYTVTTCHSNTADLKQHTCNADLLVTAAGRPNLITADMVKPGAVVIDVGINRLENGKIVGDVDFESVKDVAGYITPVPGGVGPMTVAELMKNTLLLAVAKQCPDISGSIMLRTSPVIR